MLNSQTSRSISGLYAYAGRNTAKGIGVVLQNKYINSMLSVHTIISIDIRIGGQITWNY